jgi:micrococcal nuclease
MNNYPTWYVAQVYSILDGDTFTTYAGERIRLERVDTPEVGSLGYWQARQRLSELILGAFVTIFPVAHDAYGRTVASVWRDGWNINNLMRPLG